jgi:hypothetical protein
LPGEEENTMYNNKLLTTGHDEFANLCAFYQNASTWVQPPIFGPFHFADDNDDDKGDGGGGDDDKGSKGDDDKGNDKPETYEVKIDGVMRELTMDELKEHASKSAGADEAFRKAAQMKEDAIKGIEIGKAFEKINSGKFDATDVRKLAELTGQDADEAVAAYNAELKAKDGKDDDKGTKTPSAGAKPEKIKIEDLPDDVQEIIKGARESQIEDAEKQIEKMVVDAVDKDELLGKIVIDAPEEQRTGIKEVVTSMVHGDVRAKMLASHITKEKFGAEMIRNSIQKVRAEVKKLGIPSKSSKQADRVSLLAALGPTGGLPAEVYSDEKIERVDSNDPSYHDNAVARLGQAMRKAGEKKGA